MSTLFDIQHGKPYKPHISYAGGWWRLYDQRWGWRRQLFIAATVREVSAAYRKLYLRV